MILEMLKIFLMSAGAVFTLIMILYYLHSIRIEKANKIYDEVCKEILVTENPIMRMKIVTDAYGKSGKDILPIILENQLWKKRMEEEINVLDYINDDKRRIIVEIEEYS